MNENLTCLLELNSVDPDIFEQDLYDTLIVSTFATLVKEIDFEKAWQDVKDKYRSFHDHLHVTQQIMNKYIGGTFTEQEYERFYSLLMARLRKKSNRKLYSDSTRTMLLNSQNHRCAICGCGIDKETSELDHIVPWNLVGDELKSNLQMLCIPCNRRKSATTDYALLSIFLRRDIC